MYDLARIRYVTEHYHDLQGLIRLPVSLWLLAWSAYDLGWIYPPAWFTNEWLLFPVAAIPFLALMWPIEKLYERSFGCIATERRAKVEPNKRAFWITFGVLMAIFWSVFFLTDGRPVVSKLGLYIAFFVFLEWRRRSDGKHLLVLGIVLAAMSLAPLFDSSMYPSATVRDVAIKLVAAAGILAVGTIDHVTLVRTLGPVRREEQSRA